MLFNLKLKFDSRVRTRDLSQRIALPLLYPLEYRTSTKQRIHKTTCSYDFSRPLAQKTNPCVHEENCFDIGISRTEKKNTVRLRFTAVDFHVRHGSLCSPKNLVGANSFFSATSWFFSNRWWRFPNNFLSTKFGDPGSQHVLLLHTKSYDCVKSPCGS